MYIPQIMDTSNILLPEEIIRLQETLSKNTHEHWAKNKIASGWVYGEVLDAKNKTHPDLVPYNLLSEEKKDYDRTTSMETLKLLYSLGYRLVKEKREI